MAVLDFWRSKVEAGVEAGYIEIEGNIGTNASATDIIDFASSCEFKCVGVCIGVGVGGFKSLNKIVATYPFLLFLRLLHSRYSI